VSLWVAQHKRNTGKYVLVMKDEASFDGSRVAGSMVEVTPGVEEKVKLFSSHNSHCESKNQMVKSGHTIHTELFGFIFWNAKLDVNMIL
jgi:hypothetical protein